MVGAGLLHFSVIRVIPVSFFTLSVESAFLNIRASSSSATLTAEKKGHCFFVLFAHRKRGIADVSFCVHALLGCVCASSRG